MLNRRSPISKEVGGGLAISVAASWPSVVWRPVWQISWTAPRQVSDEEVIEILQRLPAGKLRKSSLAGGVTRDGP